jgi:hypothetical protein
MALLMLLLASTTAGISLMVTQSASADREPQSRSTGIIWPGTTNSTNRCSRGEWHASSQWAMCGSG